MTIQDDETLTAKQRRGFFLAKKATDEGELWEWLSNNDIKLADLMSEKMRDEILVWAQHQVDTRDDISGDWWCDFKGIWDINIWDNEEKDKCLTVTAYLIFDDCTNTDCDNWIRLGYVRCPDHPAHGRQEDIDEYLDRYGYATVEEWAEDSNYVLRDGKWYAQDGLVVDPATCLVESIDELISRYE